VGWRGFSQSEVHQLRADLGQHDVAGFQIAMDNAGLVGFLQPFADFLAALQQSLGRKRTLPQTRGQRFAFQKFHDQVIDSAMAADIVERADIGMVQRRNRAGLAIEALFSHAVFRQMRGKNFDGDDAVEPCIACTIHLTHPASAQRRLNFIRTEFRARGQIHSWA
jgi:hypothetical protein